MIICDKNDLFRNGKNLPACLREAEFEVTVSRGGLSETRPVCAPCEGLFRNRRSSFHIDIRPLATPTAI